MQNLNPEKSYPISYPHDVLDILQKMSFNEGRDVRIMGSMSLRSQLYAADYDCYETVETFESSEKKLVKKLAKRFQDIVKDVLQVPACFIPDIKAGSMEEWRILSDDIKIKRGKLVNYNYEKCRKKVLKLEKDGVLTKDEASSYVERLSPNLTPEQWVIVKKDIRPHIIRWKPSDVEKGYQILRTGRKYTLEEAFTSPVIAKLDAVGWVQGSRFAEFSMIYKFVNKGKVLNNYKMDVEQELKESILYYSLSNRWFKVTKRMFSYARFHDDDRSLKDLTPILNSDVGRLYIILSDIQTIQGLLDSDFDIPKEKILFELDQLRGRFANIYAIPHFLRIEFQIVKLLDNALKSVDAKRFDKVGLSQDLSNISTLLLNIINTETEIELIRIGYLPLQAKYHL
jgi:hypothetical protein